MGNPVVHFEIIGPDDSALQKFYTELFGWHVQPAPGMPYGLVDTHAGAGINGGIGTGPGGGVRYVTFYVEATELQPVLDAVEARGGKTLMPVSEIVPGMVTIALFGDPAGNVVGLVQSGEGPGVSPGDGVEVSWFEILGPDPAALAAFYTETFGWHAKKADMPGEFQYFEIDTHGGDRGINGGIGSSPDGKPHTTVYARVDDLQKYTERAEALGGKTLIPPQKAGETVEIAVIADPAENMFGLYRRLA